MYDTRLIMVKLIVLYVSMIFEYHLSSNITRHNIYDTQLTTYHNLFRVKRYVIITSCNLFQTTITYENIEFNN